MEARYSESLWGAFSDSEGNKVCSIRLSRKCQHSLESLSETSCGHPWCAVCRGHVDVKTRVVFDSDHATITTNRKGPKEYQYVFGGSFEGVHRLTDAVLGLFPKGKVRVPCDIFVWQTVRSFGQVSV